MSHPALELSHTAMSEEDALRFLDGHRIRLGSRTMDPKAQIEVPKEAIPPGAKVGTRLQGRSPTGQPQIVRVKEIKDKTVVLDTNHPLAGMTLHFDIKIVGVQPPTQ